MPLVRNACEDSGDDSQNVQLYHDRFSFVGPRAEAKLVSGNYELHDITSEIETTTETTFLYTPEESLEVKKYFKTGDKIRLGSPKVSSVASSGPLRQEDLVAIRSGGGYTVYTVLETDAAMYGGSGCRVYSKIKSRAEPKKTGICAFHKLIPPLLQQHHRRRKISSKKNAHPFVPILGGEIKAEISQFASVKLEAGAAIVGHKRKASELEQAQEQEEQGDQIQELDQELELELELAGAL